ncbi:putative disease resistance protein [Senna tora]|uniref:Putative disease resistance protein n=1 Tax=Senna tora TaxID=362788 RepID=A0A834XIS6_9FABA|nr:putative disease resistance protein [Senna tora]
MADCITPAFDILRHLWGCSAKKVTSIRKLEDNLSSLRNASDQLKSVCVDVKIKVELAKEEPHLKLLNEVTDWLGKVEALRNEVQVILQKGAEETQRKCLGGCCPKNCRASYKLSKKVMEKLGEVRELTSKGHFDVVAQNFAQVLFDEMPLEKTVGLESAFDELCACFENDKVGIIGLYGMGGVGKTTLLKKFNNEFLPTRTHNVVIWAVVSKEADLDKIQDVIRNKLHVHDGIWVNKTVDERAVVLYRILKKKKFVLLLDDVWGRIDLLKLGVPPPNNYGSKILFTTRSKEVCGHMEAHTCFRIECLAPEKAFELFKEKVGESTLDSHPDIPYLAKIVADECKGLPLALCTVGRSMANKVTPIEWRRAIAILKSYPSRFSGMVDYVYHLLEFSYNRLSTAIHKSCFLYCSLFPEDYSIKKDELILLWIGEGFLAEFDDDVYEARNQGEDIISSLKYASLLEDGDVEHSVKVHDVIRDMALWVACDHGEKTKFLVKDGAGFSAVEIFKCAKWKEVEKLSLWGPRIQYFTGKPHFPHLLTMLLRDTQVEKFPNEVFLLTNTIRVLDLSGNRKLRNLQATIGDFLNLEYMNVSGTGITELPGELMNLKKLRCLMLNQINHLEFPREVISSLLSLQTFSMLHGHGPASDENILLNELEGLEQLQDVSIALSSPFSVQKLLNSPKLQKCMSHLRLYCDLNTSSIQIPYSSLKRMEHLKTLSISGCKSLRFNMEKQTLEGFKAGNILRSSNQMHEYAIRLKGLYIYGCEMFDLNWLKHAPNLEILNLYCCASLETVVSEDIAAAETERVRRDLFSSLTVLHLQYLTKLRSICRIALLFPCLKEIEVIGCPNLTKLPLDSQSAVKNLKHIKGEPSWWDQLHDRNYTTRLLLKDAAYGAAAYVYYELSNYLSLKTGTPKL